jgi:hypothetical protein
LNKFAPLVFVLLLSCGAALWFLASDSLNFHIKNQFQVIGSELSQQNVSVENVSILGYQGTGTITNFLITPPNSSELQSANQATLSISSIDLAINHESLKKEVVIIDSITIKGLNASFYYNKEGTSLKNLLETVQQRIRQRTIQENNTDLEQQLKIAPPLIKASKVFIEQGSLNLIDDKNEQVITKVITAMEFEVVVDEAGKKGEKIGIEIFEKLLIELNKQTTLLQGIATKSM